VGELVRGLDLRTVAGRAALSLSGAEDGARGVPALHLATLREDRYTPRLNQSSQGYAATGSTTQ
jgi:hypothetical protein